MKNINNKTLFYAKWILARLNKNKAKLVLILLLLIVYVVFQTYLPILNRNLLDNGLVAFNIAYSYKIVCIILVVNILCLIIQKVKEKIRLQLYRSFKEDLSCEAYNHLFRLSYHNIENRDITELTMTTETDIDMISLVTDELFLTLITQIAIFVGATIGLFYIDYRLAFIIICYIPVKIVISIKLSNKNLCFQKKTNIQTQVHLGWLGNAISGLKEVRLFEQTDMILDEYRDRNNIRIDLAVNKSWLNSWKAIINGFSNDVITFVIYIVGITFSLVYNSLSVGSIIAFVTFTQRVIQPLNFVLDSRFIFSNIIPSIQRYLDFLKLDEEISKSGKKLQSKINQIEFESVHFSYVEGKEVLNDVSFSIKKCDKIALVGKNGTGKSTIIDILLGLYNVSQGNIFINSCKLNELNLTSYRQRISVVSQSVYLFNDSIKNNITFHQDVDKDQLNEILDLCGLKEFICKVGLDYNVGVGGTRLSGGQRQKVALARALLKNSDVYIFDEVTSNADQDSNYLIRHIIKKYLKDKIVIISTHNNDLISEMSKTMYLLNGKVYFH